MVNESTVLRLKLHMARIRLAELSATNASLRAENIDLKRKIESDNKHKPLLFDKVPPSLEVSTKCTLTTRPTDSDSQSMSKAKKITLFRELFSGREDVYPVRWENLRTGKSGYSPAIKNKWDYLESKKAGHKNVSPEYLYLYSPAHTGTPL